MARHGRDEGTEADRRGPEQPSLFGSATEPSESGSRPLTILVDGTALAYRSYFALKRLSTSRGVPTNAVYGFVRALLDLLRTAGAGSEVVVAFDAPGRTVRAEEYEEYKAQRPPMPSDLPQQLGLIKQLVDLLGVPRLELRGTEADDLLATLARRAVEAGRRVEIITSDRDTLQLVSQHVTVRSPDARGPVGPVEVLEKYGVRPDQWVDYRALTGDASDNIPGVPGIGPVAARTLLERYGTLDAVLDELGSIEPARYDKLLSENLDQLHLSRRLSQLMDDVELPADLRLTRAAVDEEGLTELLRALEFGSVLRELGLTEAVEYADEEFGQLLHSLTEEGDGTPWSYGYVLSSERPTAAEVTDLALAHGGSVATAPAPLMEHLQGAVNAPDAKALVVAARRAGADVTPGHDPLLMAYLLDAAATGPEALARRLGAGEWGESATSRAVVGAELLRLLGPRLEGAQLRIYQEVEQPLQTVLAEMELVGIQLDLEVLGALTEQVNQRLEKVEARLREIAEDPTFNVASRDQVAALLFDKLELRAGRRTSTGKLSTAVSALEPLTGQHEAVDLILEHRELAKLAGTYLGPLTSLADEDGRIHTTFQQAVVATGRLSSVNPNLQNIPVRTAIGREVRRAFVATPGYTLLVADYSQIELRILAHMADEPVLTEAFRAGADIHAATAASIFGVPLEEVDGEMRRVAKTINFGVLYGMGPQRLSRELNLAYGQAESFIATYFARYPRVKRFVEETLARGAELGYVETLLGRRRGVLELRSSDRAVREAAERMTFNMPVQGTAADIMKLAMLELAPALAQLDGRLLLQVHDEIVAEVKQERAEEAAERVESIMSQVYPLKVPLLADVKLGANWLEAH